jgi:DNA-binding FadR family transcriptional regulator
MSRIWFLPHWQFQDFNLTEGEHERLYKALQSRDPAGASAAMKDHIASLRKRITRAND